MPSGVMLEGSEEAYSEERFSKFSNFCFYHFVLHLLQFNSVKHKSKLDRNMVLSSIKTL